MTMALLVHHSHKLLSHPHGRKDTDSVHLPKTKQRPEWLKPILDDERPVIPEPAWVIPTSHIPNAVNNWANALATTYQAPTDNSLLEKTGDMRTFMNWYCQKMGKTELTQADLEGQAYEIATPEGDQIRIDISKPMPLSGPPGVQKLGNFHDLPPILYLTSLTTSLDSRDTSFLSTYGLPIHCPSIKYEYHRNHIISSLKDYTHVDLGSSKIWNALLVDGFAILTTDFFRERNDLFIPFIRIIIRVLRIILVVLPEHPSDTYVFTMKMEIMLEPTSSKLMVGKLGDSDVHTLKDPTLILEIMSRRFFLRLNLPDHRLVLTRSEGLSKDGDGDTLFQWSLFYNRMLILD
ncbi:hypothetical protein Tco_0719656 [Tanacetum coccineum]